MIRRICTLLLCACMVFVSTACTNQTYNDTEEPGEKKTQRQNKNRDFDGSIIVFSFDSDAASVDSVEAVLERRLTSLGYTEASISTTKPGEIKVEIPFVYDVDYVCDVLSSNPKLTFCDASGNVVLDGDDIQSAQAQYGELTEGSGVDEYYVELTFTKEGRKAFIEATKAAASASEGQRYISIMMDDTLISQPNVSPEYASTGIDSETCIISGSFDDKEGADSLAETINSGRLSADLNVVHKEVLYPEKGDV